MDNQFRSAVFGGFHRQDVMDYLEHMVKDHAQALDEANNRLTDARNEADQLRGQLAAAQKDAQQVRQELEQIAVSQQTAREQVELLDQLQEEHSRLHSRITRLEPDAQAYAAIKERTASIELEAHCRAQAIVDEAQKEAEQLLGELAQWLERVERDYYDLRAQVGNTVTHAASELERVRQGLDNISLCMTNQHSALERMIQTAKNYPAERAE